LVRGEPEERAVHYAVLRSMKKAVYSPEVEGHYALNSQHYCHFTSPIRRYPDLTIHRMVDALVRERTPVADFDQQALLGEHCSEREQRAEKAERELIKVKLLTYMSQRIGEQIDAVVTGVERFGLFAMGTELPAEGLIHISSMQDDNYRFDANTHSLTGFREGNSYRLGELIRVEVAHVDIDRRELDFRLVGPKQRATKQSVKQNKPKRASRIGARDAKKTGKKKSGAKKSSRRAKGQRGKR
jgi:ribonuclease R